MAKTKKETADEKAIPSRSQFIRDKLAENRRVKYQEVAAAWAATGHPGEIKSTLFYLVKSKSKKGKGRRAVDSADETSPREMILASMEKTLDRLMADAISLKDAKLMDELRIARRRVSAMLV